jgi:hypothetical protein
MLIFENLERRKPKNGGGREVTVSVRLGHVRKAIKNFKH